LLQSAGDGDGRLVIAGTIWKLVPMLLGLFGGEPGAVGQTVTRLMVQDEVIIRVPVQPRPLMPQIDWIEHKGPRCIAAGDIRRVLLSGPTQVDFILADRGRVRAQFDEDCPALDFYAGVYLQTADDRLCVRRDAVQSRIGGSCTIERFRKLVPKVHQ
jgi:hypothetical protein